MDATASREPTWDHACAIQGEMFVATDSLGGLDVRLAFYRGFEEFKISRWTSDGRELARLISSVRCLAGRTQIARLLRYAADQRRGRVITVGRGLARKRERPARARGRERGVDGRGVYGVAA